MNELLREMQREKQHMRIVIDEYGGVAGLVTIEDLLEEIVGAITDEHEDDSEANAPKQESEGVWIVPGNLEVDALEALTGDEDLRDGHYCRNDGCRTGERSRGAYSDAGRGGAGRQDAAGGIGLDRPAGRAAARLCCRKRLAA